MAAAWASVLDLDAAIDDAEALLDPAALADLMLSELRARNPEWERRRQEAMKVSVVAFVHVGTKLYNFVFPGIDWNYRDDVTVDCT
jgi:hypothetical protein